MALLTLPIWCSELLSGHALHVGVLEPEKFRRHESLRGARNLATVCHIVYMPPLIRSA